MVPGTKNLETLMNRSWEVAEREELAKREATQLRNPFTYLVDFSRVTPGGSERWRLSMWTSFLSVLLLPVEWA